MSREPLRTIALLVALGLLVHAAPAVAGGRGNGPKVVTRAITRTHGVIEAAAAAVKSGKQGKPELRKAVVHNLAARATLRKGDAALAAHLTLKARGFARDALRANQRPVPKSDETDAPEETAAAQGAKESAAAAPLAAADKEIPPAGEIAGNVDLDADP